MKKLNLLTLSAALLMGLASCGGNNNASSTPASDASTPASVQPSAPTSENVSVDYAALAERAYQQISATYDDWAKGITSEQTIYLTTKVDGVEFTVEYAISDEAKDYLKIEGDKLVVTADEEDHPFVNAVTVTVKFDGTAYATHSLNVKVSALAFVKLSAIWDMKKDDAVTSRGKITAMYGKNFFMQDGEVGTEVYTSADWGVKVGDYVEVAGVISVYNGLYEIVPNKEGGVVILDGAGGVEEPVNIELGPDTDISEAKAVGGRIFSATNLYVKEISLEQSSSSGYYVKGTVLADGKDGTKKLTLRIEERYAGREMMESWGVSYDAAGVPTLGDTISAGDILEVNGILNWYNAPQISLATVTKVTEGEAPADPIEIPATFAEVITAGKALASGESSYDYYVFDAYVVKNSGTNYFLAATADANTDDDKALFEIFKASEANQAKLLKGAKVHVKTKIKNYNTQVEDAGEATLTITVVEAGEPWVVNYTEVDVAGAITAANALADNATSTELYKVSGFIIAVTSAYSAQYGNISFTLGATADATETLTVFRLACTADEAAKFVPGTQLTVGGNLKNFVQDNAHTAELVNVKVLEWGNIPDPVEVNYGTLESPLSVSDLLGDDGTICAQTQKSFSAEKVVVQGVLKSAEYSDGYGTWTLELADSKDATEKIKATGVTLSPDVAAKLAPNDTVIVEHYLEYFNNAYALYYKKNGDEYDYGQVLARTVGTSVLTAEGDHATVNGLAESYDNDAEASFTVVVEEGYEIVSVKVYGTKLTAEQDGSYKVVIAGDGKIEVETQEAGAELPDTDAPSYEGYAPVAKYKFVGNGSTELSDANLLGLFTDGVQAAKGLSDIVTAVSGASKVYTGYSNFESLGIKFGTSGANGTFTVALSQNVSRVVVSAIGWGTTDTLKVGDADAQTLHGKYSDRDAATANYIFDVTAANSLTFTLAKRGFIDAITFYTAVAD